MTTEITALNWRKQVGRFSVEIEVANYDDIAQAKIGAITPEKVRRTRLAGLVDIGATRLVLPAAVVAALGLPETGKVEVRLADGRRAEKVLVSAAQVEIQSRSGVFSAIVEPGRSDALIGAIVLEELDLLPDCTAQVLRPRDPRWPIAEIE